MDRSKCWVVFCVASAVCNQIGGGLFVIIIAAVFARGIDVTGLALSILGCVLYMVAGALLLAGAIKRKRLLVFIHFVAYAVSLVTEFIACVVLVIAEGIGRALDYIFVPIAFLVVVLLGLPFMFVVRRFYKQLKSERQTENQPTNQQRS